MQKAQAESAAPEPAARGHRTAAPSAADSGTRGDPAGGRAAPESETSHTHAEAASGPSFTRAKKAPLTAHDEAAHSAASTAQLNDSTEANLNGIKRTLSAQEQIKVSQIRDYLSQCAQATKDGDVMRARNLALKAHLLSDELAKPR